MKIAVCGGNHTDVLKMIELLKKYFSVRNCTAEIYSYGSTNALMTDLQFDKAFDAVFLCMDNYENKDSEIKSCENIGEIVFAGGCGITIDEAEIFDRMDKIIRDLYFDSYVVKRRGKLIRLPYSCIKYIESRNSKCLIHTLRGDFTVYKHLSDIENELDDSRFLRCHRSYLVNMSYIVTSDRDFILNTGERVLIRQKSMKEIKRRYYDFLLLCDQSGSKII